MRGVGKIKAGEKIYHTNHVIFGLIFSMNGFLFIALKFVNTLLVDFMVNNWLGFAYFDFSKAMFRDNLRILFA